MPPNWQPSDHFYEMGHVSQPAPPPSGFRAVKNVWYERTRSHVTHYRRFYSIIAGLSVCAIIAFTLLGVLLPRSMAGGGGDSNNSDSSSTSISTQPSATGGSSASPTSSGKPSSSSPAVGSNCDPAGFTDHVSAVADYDPSVPSPQFKIVPAKGAAECCQACYKLSPQHCNGWGWIGSMCNVIYDYPGDGEDDTCPKGYPKITISQSGPDGNFGGNGPCGSKDS
ncbi:hypothetical protein PGQ11_014491 [Apiospora arundinis]|uniref:Uncharacterized protein n=1 Tax=Apiospora arundinis TaxID=335852 RepID=A0ABR2HTN1_9PEZI